MLLSKIIIKNDRLIINAELNVDSNTTVLVGRNNTAKPPAEPAGSARGQDCNERG